MRRMTAGPSIFTLIAALATTQPISAQGSTRMNGTPRPGEPRAAAVQGGVRVSAQRARSNASCVIQGNALDSVNRPLASAVLRLRDARSGRISESLAADKTGLFTFTGIEPGSYVVELVGPNQTILAASGMLYANAGDVTSTLVKLPSPPPLSGVLGPSTGSAALVIAAAAASGVLATQVSGNAVSPRQ